MAVICYLPKGACKTCPHYRKGEDLHSNEMCCWKNYDEKHPTEFKEIQQRARLEALENKVYHNISDCWQALRGAESVEEVETLFGNFPRWSGDWEWFYDNGSFCVRNTYFDEQYQNEEEDVEELDCLSFSDEEE